VADSNAERRRSRCHSSALMAELSHSRTLQEHGATVSIVPTRGGAMAMGGVRF